MEMKITDADLSVGTCFGPLDAVLYAFGHSTVQDGLLENDECVLDAIRRWLRENLKDAVIEGANTGMTVEQMADVLGCSRDAVTGEYLAGDWADIEAPESFDTFLREIRESLENDIQSFIEGETNCGIPPALAHVLRGHLETEEAEMHNILKDEAVKEGLTLIHDKLHTDSVVYGEGENTLCVQWGEDSIRDFYAYDLEDEAPLPDEKSVQTYFTEWIKNKIAQREQEEKNRRLKREEAQKLRAEREQKALEAKKQKARERKKAATTKPLA